uniref:Uncharacterized protein n=1 Tax=Nelumbo nucifera TaxID=4432 RepID=A0A822Y4T1_NELNU|nr:TPA_asm: hypothetical protein HUJ06_026082 [Nelumbo nucifera]
MRQRQFQSEFELGWLSSSEGFCFWELCLIKTESFSGDSEIIYENRGWGENERKGEEESAWEREIWAHWGE